MKYFGTAIVVLGFIRWDLTLITWYPSGIDGQVAMLIEMVRWTGLMLIGVSVLLVDIPLEQSPNQIKTLRGVADDDTNM